MALAAKVSDGLDSRRGKEHEILSSHYNGEKE